MVRARFACVVQKIFARGFCFEMFAAFRPKLAEWKISVVLQGGFSNARGTVALKKKSRAVCKRKQFAKKAFRKSRRL